MSSQSGLVNAGAYLHAWVTWEIMTRAKCCLVALRIGRDGQVSVATVVRLWEVRVLLVLPKS